MHPEEILQNNQRLRYEAFSNFVTGLSTCHDMEGIGKALASHLKFIVDFFVLTFYVKHLHTTLHFKLFRGNVTLLQDAAAINAGRFEACVAAKGLPQSLTASEIQEQPLLRDTDFLHRRVDNIYALPMDHDHHNHIVIVAASAEPRHSPAVDSRFFRLIGESLYNKLSQLLLQASIEEQNMRLEQQHAEIKRLNQGLEAGIQVATGKLVESNRELRSLFYHTAHEFRAPLMNILALSNLADMLFSDPQVLEMFANNRAVVHNLDRMLVKLNTMSADVDPGRHTVVDFHDVFTQLLLRFDADIEQLQASISLHDQSVTPFVCDARTLLNILEYLVENALLYTRERPSIGVKISELEEQLLITVQDNGQGVPPELQEKVFDMYYRGNTASTGHGLGLYVTRKLVDQLGGQVWLESEYGAWTRISVLLPHQNHPPVLPAPSETMLNKVL